MRIDTLEEEFRRSENLFQDSSDCKSWRLHLDEARDASPLDPLRRPSKRVVDGRWHCVDESSQVCVGKDGSSTNVEKKLTRDAHGIPRSGRR